MKTSRIRKSNDSFMYVTRTSVTYMKGNKIHREDGPAVVYFSGEKQYRQNGKIHRIDGPAELSIQRNVRNYWINGKMATKEQHDFYHDLMTLKGLL